MSLLLALDSGVNYGLTCNAGSFSLAGQEVIVTFTPANAYNLTALHAHYDLTGNTITISKNSKLNANSGTYSLTGQSSSEYKYNVLNASTGSFSLSGQVASTLKGSKVIASNGSYSLTGQDAILQHITAGSYELIANHGHYSLTGIQQNITKSYVVESNYGNLSLNGQTANLVYAAPSISLNANAGTYALQGIDANLAYNGHVQPQQGGGSARVLPQIVIVEVDGKEYRVNVAQLPTFLDSIKTEVVEPVKKKRKKKAKKVVEVQEVVTKAPEIVIKSAPIDLVPAIQSEIDRVNVIIANAFSKALQQYLQKQENDIIQAELSKKQDEDEEEWLLMLL